MTIAPKVLCCIEDDPDMRLLIQVTLRLDDRITFDGGADNIPDAVEEVRRVQPDLVILDHFIHGSTMGLQGAPLLKAAAPTAKILLFTSHDLTVESAREPAVDTFLRKGDIAELLTTVRRMLDLTPSA